MFPCVRARVIACVGWAPEVDADALVEKRLDRTGILPAHRLQLTGITAAFALIARTPERVHADFRLVQSY